MKQLEIFKQFFKGYGWIYLLGVVLLVIINGFFLAIPTLMGQAINTLYHGREGLWDYIYGFIGILVAVTILKFCARHLVLGSIRKFEFLLRRTLFHHALYIPTSYYEEHGPGKVMALMTNDVTSLRVSLGLGVMIFVDAVVFGVISFFMMAKEISLLLAITCLLPMPFIVVAMLMVSRRMRAKQKEAQASYSDITEYGQELFTGMAVIRSFNREWIAYQRFMHLNTTNYDNNRKVALLDALLYPLTFMAPFLCYAINMYVCGQLILEGTLSVGDFVALNGYVMLVIGPIMGIGSLSSVLQKGLASLDRIYEFLQIPLEREEDDGTAAPLGDICFDHISFTYPQAKVAALKDVQVSIRKGTFLGIVGGPGSGKSTFIKLLMRIQEPAQGSISIDGQSIYEHSRAWLRRSIAYVPARALVLGTTIEDNITFGEERKETISVEEAAERAGLMRDLWERRDEKLKESGSNLSGGQKQRINMARAFYKNAPYLILDDSFSDLDTLSAAHILEHLRSGREQTIICISQRPEILVSADQILVFKDGSIVELGTHEELMACGGEYMRISGSTESRDAQEGGEGHEA